MKPSLLLALLLVSFSLVGQQEDYIWYIGGGGAGLDFHMCEPVVLTNMSNDGQAFEGSVTVSDGSGSLLFYSNGYNVYNRLHQLMVGGYQGGFTNTSTQNCIVKKPGATDLYYLITPDVQGGLVQSTSHPGVFGIKYAEINMALQGGLGAVVSSYNALKDTSNCEKLCVVPHQNGTDFWLIGHEFGNSNFFVFQITSNGFAAQPTIQSIGPIISSPQVGIAGNSNFDAIGELKASPNGDRLCFTSFYNGITALFDFDAATGVISDPILLDLQARGGYGVSFSPNALKLYITCADTSMLVNSPVDFGELIQFDLSSNVASTIQSSLTSIYTCSGCRYGSAKLAPNRKIYVARFGETGNYAGDSYLGVINNPDGPGPACDFVHDGLYLEGLKCSWGLNNYMERNSFCGHDPNAVAELEGSRFSISPNPMIEGATLSFDDQGGSNFTLEITDIKGAVVRTTAFFATNTIHIERKELLSGMYFFRLTSKKRALAGRFIVD